MSQFERLLPQSLEEAMSMISEYGERAEIIAGGTDLLVRMKRGDPSADFFISLERLNDLEYIKFIGDEGLRIGARTTIRSILDEPLVKKHFKALHEAVASHGTPSIRNMATLGGNLCNAAPSADTAPALLVLGARAKIRSVTGEQIVPLEDFFRGPGETILKQNGILVEIGIPIPPPNSGAVYLKQKRSKGADLAIAGVAVSIEMAGEVMKDVKIALGAVAPTPIRAKKAEAVLKGKKSTEALFDEAGQVASGESNPIDDVRGSAGYRRKLVAVLVKRALGQAVEYISMEV